MNALTSINPLLGNRSTQTVQEQKMPARKSSLNLRFLSLFTSVLCLGCLAVGVLGIIIPHAGLTLVGKPAEPVQAELLNVELTSEDTVASLPIQSQALPSPSAPEKVLSPAIPQPNRLEPFSPNRLATRVPALDRSNPVAFPVAAKNPQSTVPTEQVQSQNGERSETASAAHSAPQTLQFGFGVGKQPAPEYPWQAARDGQEGIVKVEFSVAENGRVSSARAAEPSAWTLLNEAAVRTVRQRWKFSAGKLRTYEVAIRFELAK